MTDDPSPTLRRRELGAELRRLRRGRGWTTKDLADRTGFSVSKVSRMETGERGVSAPDIAALTALFDLDDDEAARLDFIARNGKRRRTHSQSLGLETDYIKIEQSGFLDLERDATRIREYNSCVIPGLLQTDAYMRAAMAGAAPDLAPDDLESAVDVRRRRQRKALGATGAAYEVIVDEAALHRLVGGPSAMAAQLDAVTDAILHERVVCAVIPFAVGAHPGANSDFVALQIDPEVPDVIFVEGLVGHLRLDRFDERERYGRVWSQLLGRASSAEESLALLRDVRDSIRDGGAPV